ncbi:GNAT family N-acetyltransferase [Shimia sp. MMG029]|uniref:GNAT family N-acetyltransferase n=1 Tax=Shimia sp. MMG029 TaxID=3021978 RepID=UPI0022FDC657|nr:GNAT family N-acetyltransferase [Shimia sp. MMG029]MDA5557590.1 GNAT family N-acetyltransferase [Shimia sp. MMG029]
MQDGLGIVITIRPARASDQGALYDIVLKTGLSGADASHLYNNPKMLGHIYTAPYVALVPALAFVAERDGRVVGYVCGVAQTRAFEALQEVAWWPALRNQYACPEEASRTEWTADQIRAAWIHHPTPTPAYVAGPFPAHLHMNLSPEVRGAGLGRRLFETWCAAAKLQGVHAMHIGANPANAGGIAFWARMGFERLETPAGEEPSSAAWMGRSSAL